MAKIIIFSELIGKKFGYYTIIGEGNHYYNPKTGKKTKIAHCRCECGVEKDVACADLFSKGTLSCGCYRNKSKKERGLKIYSKHNAHKTKEYAAWSSMKYRCNNPLADEYKDYGGRGISVCDRWMDKENGFTNFIEDIGKKPIGRYSLGRIDNNKGYEKSNCRWETDSQQCRNTRATNFITYNGQTKCITEWSEVTGLTSKNIHNRIFRDKWSIEDALTTPKKNYIGYLSKVKV